MIRIEFESFFKFIGEGKKNQFPKLVHLGL